MPQSSSNTKRPRVNVRRPDVMERVTAEVAHHYSSPVVERIQALNGRVSVGNTTVLLARQFGFCYGVERAIDLAYAARRVFPDQRVFLIGEIIHNPDVNQHLRQMNIVSLPWREMSAEYEDLGPDDVVIVPAFGAPVAFMDFIEKRGCQLVDTTCGDVMKVWKRVRGYAKDGVTSIIHGKADHEETRATASRALGTDGNGHFLVILTLNDAERLCHYIQHGGDKTEFMQHFSGSHSANFDPDLHLTMLGVANQTTMLKGETEEIQRRIREAVIKRDGDDSRFHCFDTICGATQERQDALIDMLGEPMDLMLVVGGYNSSNTAHLVEIAEKELPTFFIRDSSCLRSMEEICHFDLHQHQETLTRQAAWLNPDQATKIGITAGASCPNNLIEETVLKVFELRGISQSELLGAIQPSSQD